MKTQRRAKYLVPLVLVALVILECLFLFTSDSFAEPVYPCTGIITADPSCNMRQDPSTAKPSLRSLRKEVQVTVVGAVRGEAVGSNNVWYVIRYSNMEGYVSSDFVRLVQTAPSPVTLPAPNEQQFKEQLQAQGFPEDYAQKLMELYRKHPNWSFKALHTNYSFDTAVQGQYKPGLNLVPSTSPDEFKSRAEQDFNYHANTWHEYEAGWVGASRELIAYQMDPRNFLDETQIFQFENQKFSPETDYSRGLSAILKDTFMDGPGPIVFTDTNGQQQSIELSYLEGIIKAGENSGVSPYHLASRIRQEVGSQGSGSVTGKYRDLPGYYNFYNIGATGSSDPVYSGLITARDGIKGNSASKSQEYYFPWIDPLRSIAGGAVFIGKDYINVDQHTLYLQKFNLVSRFTRPFTHQYMGNVLAPEYEAVDVYKAYQAMGAMDDKKEFVIPVFAQMPAVTVAPTDGGNPNNWLMGIAVNGEIIQDFVPTRFEYKVQISSRTDGVVVSALAWNPNAQINGLGIYQLKPGKNEIIIQVVAPNGELRNYRLQIQQGDNAPSSQAAEPKLQLGDYHMTALGYIYGADPSTGSNRRDAVLGSFASGAGFTTELLGSNGQAVEVAGTGAVVAVREGAEIVNRFPLVILGDVNGDASIDIMDANVIYNFVSGQKTALDTAYTLAMDVNQDGQSDILDANLIYNHVSGVALIKQKIAK